MSLLHRVFAVMRSALSRHSAPQTVRLTVTDEDERVVADVADAQPRDFWLSVPLPSDTVVVNLSGHYQRFIEAGGKRVYRGTDAACNTYVKFGECIQDRRQLHILIQPSAYRGNI